MTNTKLTRDDKLEIYKLCLKGARQVDIAEKFGIDQSTVSNIYNNIIKQNDRDLAVSTALEFVAEYSHAKDYLIMKRTELEELLTLTDEPKEKEKIIMSQVAITQLIVTHVMQGKFMQALQQHANDGELALK